jgi:hypothetical protein
VKRTLGAAIAATLCACGSDPAPVAPDPSGFSADDPTAATTDAMSAELARDLSIAEVAVYQAVKVSLAKDGKPGDRVIGGTGGKLVPLVAGRGALLRVFVNPSTTWKPAPVTARVKVQLVGPAGSETRVFYTKKTLTNTASTDGDLDSTINIDLPGDALRPGATFGVVLSQVGGARASGADSARYPQDGSLGDMQVNGGGDVVKVVIVPMAYDADKSGRLPDTGDAQLKLLRDRFYRLYPAAKIDFEVHEPVSWTQVIAGGGAGFDSALKFISSLRQKDNAPVEAYYYGAFEPAATFGAFCQNGCITGLSGVGTPASVGIGYAGEESAITAAHEVGHAHGLDHAPFCGAQGPGNYWPSDASHAGAHIGTWGYDAVDKRLLDPAKYTDLMSYCPSNWISDFHYGRLFDRVKGDNRYFADAHGPVGAWRTLRIATDGRGASWDETAVTQPWVMRGEPRQVAVRMADGSLSQLAAFFFPYDHLPGGLLMFPESAIASARSVSVVELGREIAVSLR